MVRVASTYKLMLKPYLIEHGTLNSFICWKSSVSDYVQHRLEMEEMLDTLERRPINPLP